MTILAAAKAVLEADATLLALATGGIYDANEAGRMGVNRTSTPAILDSNRRIKPFIFVRARSSNPDGALADDASQYVSLQEMLEVWFYEDSGYSVIRSMRNRVYALLHARQLSGTFDVRWQFDMRGQRDPGLDASTERSDYKIVAKRSV